MAAASQASPRVVLTMLLKVMDIFVLALTTTDEELVIESFLPERVMVQSVLLPRLALTAPGLVPVNVRSPVVTGLAQSVPEPEGTLQKSKEKLLRVAALVCLNWN